MKKSKLLVLGLIGLLLTSGMIFASCTMCPGGNNPNFGASYGVGSNKGGCTYSGYASSLKDCQNGCLESYAYRNPGAYSFSCDC